jgi:hypothetical protein
MKDLNMTFILKVLDKSGFQELINAICCNAAKKAANKEGLSK